MLRKKYRLNALYIGNSRSFNGLYFRLKIAKNNLEVSRFAFVVSKRIDKRATVRNKLKRKVRSIVEETLDNINSGYDFVFYLKKDSVNLSREEISKVVKEVFSKNKLLRSV